MSLLCRALSRVILRLHLHTECSREGEGNKLKHTPPVPQEAMCEIYIQSFINHFICCAWVISLCNALKREPEAVICSVNRSPPPRLPRYQVWSVSLYLIIKLCLLKKKIRWISFIYFCFCYCFMENVYSSQRNTSQFKNPNKTVTLVSTSRRRSSSYLCVYCLFT